MEKNSEISPVTCWRKLKILGLPIILIYSMKNLMSSFIALILLIEHKVVSM